MTQSQQSIPSSSCEPLWFSFWSFAHASIRTTAGTSVASSNAISHFPKNLSFLFLVLVYRYILLYLTSVSLWLPHTHTSKTASVSCIPMNPSLLGCCGVFVAFFCPPILCLCVYSRVSATTCGLTICFASLFQRMLLIKHLKC